MSILNIKRKKGSTALDYGILASLISASAVGIVYTTGFEISELLNRNNTYIAENASPSVPAFEGEETVPENPHSGYVSGPVAPGEGDPACYEPANVGTVPSGTYGCGDMLTIDNDMKYSVSAPNRPTAGGYTKGDGSYAFVLDGKTYDFGDPSSGILTGQITDLTWMFGADTGYTNTYNGDISYWDTSNVTKMRGTFLRHSGFTQDISNWDTSNVKIMETVFSNSDFMGDISGWDVSNVTAADEKGIPMYAMFHNNSSFNQDLSSWCVAHVSTTPSLFSNSSTATWSAAKRPQWGQPCS